MTDSIDTSEDMAMPYVASEPAADQPYNVIARAVELLRESAAELASSVSIDGVPDWSDDYEAKVAHDDTLMVARDLEAVEPRCLEQGELDALRADRAERVRLEALINTPELFDFDQGARLEAIHQLERWASEHDEGKTPPDWFWLIGYLSGKALHHHAEAQRLQAAGMEHEYIEYHEKKALHHVITTDAALHHWHAAVLGKTTTLRPGIANPGIPE